MGIIGRLLKRNKKKTAALLLVLFSLFVVWYGFRYHTSYAVNVIIRAIFGAEIRSDSISVGNGKIVVINPSLYYKGEFIGKADRIEGKWTKESIRRLRLSEVTSWGTEAVIIRDDRDINAVTAFVGSKNKKYEEQLKARTVNIKETDPVKRKKAVDAVAEHLREESRLRYESKKQSGKPPGSRVPIDKIVVVDGVCTWIDRTFDAEIKKTLRDINGHITFTRGDGIYIVASGADGDESCEYVFSNIGQRYWMRIKAKNVTPQASWIQYGYRNGDVTFHGGKVDMDLQIGSDTKYLGWATVKGLAGSYTHYGAEATDVEGRVTFAGRRIEGEAFADVLGSREKVFFSYDGAGRFYLNSRIHDVKGRDVARYDALAERNVDLSSLSIASPEMDLLYNRDGSPRLNLSFRTDAVRYDKYRVERLSWNIERDRDGFTFRNIRGNTKILDKTEGKEETILSENDLDLTWRYENAVKGKVEFLVKQSGNSYIPPLEGVFSYDLEDDMKKHVSVDTDIAKFSLDYFPRTGKIIIGKSGDFTIDFDTKTGKIEDGKGKIPLNFKYLSALIDFEAEDNVIQIKKALIRPAEKGEATGKEKNGSGKKNAEGEAAKDKKDKAEKPQEGEEIKPYTKSEQTLLEKYRDRIWSADKKDGAGKIELSGEIDLNRRVTDLKIKADDFLFDERIKGKDIKIRGDFSGAFFKYENNKNYHLNLDVESLSLNYSAELLNFHGKIQGTAGERNEAVLFGEIGVVAMGDYATYGVKSAAGFQKGILEIKEMRNEIFDVRGSVNLEERRPELTVSVTSLNSTKLKLDAPVKFYIANARGKLGGTWDALLGTLEIGGGKLYFPGGSEAEIRGKIRYENESVGAEDFLLNENRLTAAYDIRKQAWRLAMDLNEENMTRYVTAADLRQKVTGKLTARGSGRTLAAKAQVSLKENAVKGFMIPDLTAEISYDTEEIGKGKIKLEKLRLLNGEGKQLAGGAGLIDLSAGTMELKVPESAVAFQDITSYTGLSELRGTLILSGGVSGPLSNVAYKIAAHAGEAHLNTMRFNNLVIDVSGNTERVDFNNISLLYSANALKAYGYSDLKQNKYEIRVESPKADLRFLTFLLKDNGISEIRGTTSLDLTLTDESNKGFLTLQNAGFNYEPYFLNFTDINSRIDLNQKTVTVENFTGKMNGGDVSASGKINNFTVDALQSEHRMEELDYRFDLNLRDIRYHFGKQFQLFFGAELNFAKNKLAGTLTVDEGEVKALPMETKTLFQILRDLLFKSTSKVAQAGRELKGFKVDTSFYNPVELDLAISATKGIKLDIAEVNAFVTDLKGTAVAEGTLSGKGSELVLLGEAEILDGSLSLNENGFIVDRAVMSFTDKKDYLPGINPSVSVEARVNVSGEEVKVGVHGQLDRLRFQVASMEGGSSGDLRGLLAGELDVQDETTAKLVRMILNDQIAQTFMGPITKKIKKAFGLNKFRVKSDLLNQKKQSRYGEESSELQFNAVLEAENNLWNDKLFWVTSITLMDANLGEKNTGSQEGGLQEYDVSLEYRYKPGRSFTLGAGRVPDYKKKEGSRNTGRKDSVNYHVGMKFEKKYDKLSDVWTK
ncbi:MAG: translocation/assembly module TamB [Fusobacteriaceae bacterium]|jgi:hypothetical protein|nr:translocation/assembly module TamB [Fusobacteriaceae bacterium]